MKKLFYFLSVFLAVAAVNSCRPEQEINEDDRMVFSDVPVNIGQDGEGDDTKSSVSIEVEKFQKAALFAFTSSDKKIVLKNGTPVAIETTSKSFSWSLPLNTEMDIYVIVNYGDLNLSSYLRNTGLTESTLESLTFTCGSNAELKKLETQGKGLPMAGIMPKVKITNQNSTLGIKVKKLFAKYDFYFDATEFTSRGWKVNGLYISACKSNTEVPYFKEGYKQGTLDKLQIVDLGSSTDVANLTYADGASSHKVTLYFLENCQGNKSGASNWYDVANSGMDGLNLCSYIDFGIKMTDPDGNDKNLMYWIYLGDDCKTNFDVRRNVARSIKLKLPYKDDVIPYIPPTKGITFIDDWNTYSKVPGAGSSVSFPLIFETNIPPSEWAYAFGTSGAVSGTPSFTNITSAPGYTRKTSYPYVGRLYVNILNGKSTKVTIGKKDGSTWVASDQRTLSVGADVYTVQITPNPVSVKVGDETDVTAKVYKNGSLYSYTGSWEWMSGNTSITNVETWDDNPNVLFGNAVGTTTVTATATIGGKSISGSATVNVVANFNEGFDWADTEITLDSGGSANAVYYCSSDNPTGSYTGSGIQSVNMNVHSIVATGNSSGWKYKGTATIKAKTNSGGTTGTVTGTCAGKNDQLKVKVPLKVLSMTISGPSSYYEPGRVKFTAYATLNNGTTQNSIDHDSYFNWRDDDNFFEQYDYYGTFSLDGGSGYIYCKYWDWKNSIGARASHYVQEMTYTCKFDSATLYKEKTENGYDYYFVRIEYTKRFSNGTNQNCSVDVRADIFRDRDMTVSLMWDAVWPGRYDWDGGDWEVPVGTQVRVQVMVNGVTGAGYLTPITL